MGSIILGFLIIALVSAYIYAQNGRQALQYEYEKSYHGDLAIQDNYVVERDVITVKNLTEKDLYFYMVGDFSKDYGLFTEKKVVACEVNTSDKEKFYIRAKSEQSYTANFKTKKDSKSTKVDRLPPEKVEFEVEGGSKQ